MTETWRGAIRWLSSWLPMARQSKEKLEFHGGFIPDVAKSLILRLTEKEDLVWDCFSGSGTTGLVAEELGRRCIMSDLNPTSPGIMQGDAKDMMLEEKASLIILHPPYFDIIKFSDPPLPGDLSHCPDLPAFYNLWTAVCLGIVRSLKPGGCVGLICGNIWVSGKGNSFVEPLAHNCLQILMQAIPGSKLKAIQVKNIVNNRANAHQKHLMLSRFYRWFATSFDHEMIYTIQRGK